MQGALYFPYIGVPNSAWWIRTMLYWDSVATIVPEEYMAFPERHDGYTHELIKAELLHQVFPSYAYNLGRNFGTYIQRLSGVEIDRRRREFGMGNVIQVHVDKWMTYSDGLREIVLLGLAEEPDPLAGDESWIVVESATAGEFMAALALSLCESADSGGWRYSDRTSAEKWIPVTDTPSAIRALMAGLERTESEQTRMGRVRMRVRGEEKVAEIRTQLMELLLPVPETAISPQQIVRFRKKHGHKLPEFRRYLESKIDESLTISDALLRARYMERIDDELLQRTEEVKAYLKELGFQRISKSSLLRVLQFVPGLKVPVSTTQDLAEDMRTSQAIETQPLAYLAFARTAFSPVQNYRIDPLTGMPLIVAMQQDDE